MSVRELLDELRELGVELVVDGGALRYRPKEAVTADLLDRLKRNKPRLLAHLERERRRLEEADRRGLVIKWAREPGWIALHDPTTGEWHEVKASECPPSIVAAASSRRGRERGHDQRRARTRGSKAGA